MTYPINLNSNSSLFTTASSMPGPQTQINYFNSAQSVNPDPTNEITSIKHAFEIHDYARVITLHYQDDKLYHPATDNPYIVVQSFITLPTNLEDMVIIVDYNFIEKVNKPFDRHNHPPIFYFFKETGNQKKYYLAAPLKINSERVQDHKVYYGIKYFKNGTDTHWNHLNINYAYRGIKQSIPQSTININTLCKNFIRSSCSSSVIISNNWKFDEQIQNLLRQINTEITVNNLDIALYLNKLVNIVEKYHCGILKGIPLEIICSPYRKKVLKAIMIRLTELNNPSSPTITTASTAANVLMQQQPDNNHILNIAYNLPQPGSLNDKEFEFICSKLDEAKITKLIISGKGIIALPDAFFNNREIIELELNGVSTYSENRINFSSIKSTLYKRLSIILNKIRKCSDPDDLNINNWFDEAETTLTKPFTDNKNKFDKVSLEIMYPDYRKKVLKAIMIRLTELNNPSSPTITTASTAANVLMQQQPDNNHILNITYNLPQPNSLNDEEFEFICSKLCEAKITKLIISGNGQIQLPDAFFNNREIPELELNGVSISEQQQQQLTSYTLNRNIRNNITNVIYPTASLTLPNSEIKSNNINTEDGDSDMEEFHLLLESIDKKDNETTITTHSNAEEDNNMETTRQSKRYRRQ